jgi:hypothetical protein
MITEEDKNNKDDYIRLQAYLKFGFTEEAKQDKYFSIRFYAYKKLGWTEEALKDNDTVIRTTAKYFLNNVK